ncbi:MAG: glycoside hydrolase family 9 protein [Planctomycetota bacterium]
MPCRIGIEAVLTGLMFAGGLLWAASASAAGRVPDAEHGKDDPRVVHVCAVAPEVLAVTIQARGVEEREQVPYTARPGDEIKENGHTVLAWHRGEVVKTKKNLEIHRPVDGEKERIGWLIVNEDRRWPGVDIHGNELQQEAMTEPAAYRILSADDPNYADPTRPAKVYRKSKPTQYATNGEMPVRHVVYLELPRPLKEGAAYTVHLRGLNTRRVEVGYEHRPREARSDAVHVTQIGYRAGDPFKRAYLSTWFGTGGAVSYEVERFHLLEHESGESVYEGEVRLAFAADEPEHLKEEKNYSHTDVYYLDFHEFDRPGTYRVLVPGIGCSYPFTIREGVWNKAFRTSMMGVLAHRSGIELGPPFTDYVRPRPMHPADGVKVFKIDKTFWDGEASTVRDSLMRLLGPELDPSKLETHPQAWGGYMDAGDWDRRSQHLRPTYLHLELLDMFPDYFEGLELSLPPAEAGNRLPDTMDEALWNLDFYRRLQRDSGAVGGGVESTAHPRTGECSWQESLLLGTFAPDPETTYRYAACAAKTARLMEPYDAKRASGYAESAERAWQWAEQNAERMLRDQQGKKGGTLHWKAVAAAELYHLTEREGYHDAFRDAIPDQFHDRQRDAWFAYALLPERLADPALRRKALEGYRSLGDISVEFAERNAFNLVTDIPQLPTIGYVGYWTVPGMTVGPGVTRAHYLTGDERYLRAAVAGAQFTAGANPMNMTMTTGLGHDYPRAPLHIDSRRSGQPAPPGITVFGPSDPGQSGRAYDWAHKWRLGPTMVPESRSWPASEFYVDIYGWPPMNEYTVHQCLGPVSYHFGYLAAQER